MAQNMESDQSLVLLNSCTLDPGYVWYLHHSDNPNCNLTNEPLTVSNYNQWKRSCEVSLNAKNKMLFVIREYARSASNYPLLPLWERYNRMVISWLLYYVDKDIATSIVYTPTAA